MSKTDGYRDGTALWAAASARAKAVAGADVSTLLRRFVNERFLARVFHDAGGQWVLKGGTAVLARVNDARTTKDVDLLHELKDVDAALERLRAAIAIDLDDHFRFVITGHEASLADAGQPRIDRYRVHVDAYCGTARRGSFGVDLVTGSLMTSEPEVMADTVLELRGLSSPPMRLYPWSTMSLTSCARRRLRTAQLATDRRAACVTSSISSCSPGRRTSTATLSSARSAPSGSTVASTTSRCSRRRRIGIGFTHQSQGRSARAGAWRRTPPRSSSSVGFSARRLTVQRPGVAGHRRVPYGSHRSRNPVGPVAVLVAVCPTPNAPRPTASVRARR